MASRYKNITIDQGTDFSANLEIYKTPASTAKESLGAQHYANSQIRKSYSHTNSALTFSTSVDSGADTVTITANNIQTKALKSGRYVYEVVITFTGGSTDDKWRAVEGIATVTPSAELGSMYTGGSSGYT